MNLRSDSLTSVKNFVWCGNQIGEERDATNNVTKRYYVEGEKRIGGSEAGSYYYSRDHLGSIREVTNSSGTLTAQYDYDPYGQPAVVSGTVTIDFGYTGHYFHAPSGLNLRSTGLIIRFWEDGRVRIQSERKEVPTITAMLQMIQWTFGIHWAKGLQRDRDSANSGSSLRRRRCGPDPGRFQHCRQQHRRTRF